MVKVKICGITCREDAREAIAAGADALGFVFFPASPRAVTEAQVRDMTMDLPPFVTRVGLFVDEAPERIDQIVRTCQLDLVQLHGNEPPEVFRRLTCRAVKALRVRDRASLLAHQDYPGSAVLLDAWCADRYGGTGARFDWTLAAEVACQRPVILAGGLTPENVAEAVRVVHPYAVDVSSGVETIPGRKDPLRVQRFIRNAKDSNNDLPVS